MIPMKKSNLPVGSLNTALGIGMIASALDQVSITTGLAFGTVNIIIGIIFYITASEEMKNE